LDQLITLLRLRTNNEKV
jgi:hypothetical protein